MSSFERKRLERMMELLVNHPERIDDPFATYDTLVDSSLFDYERLKRAMLASIQDTRRRRKANGDDAGAKRLDGLVSIMELLLDEKDFDQAMRDMDCSIQAATWRKRDT